MSKSYDKGVKQFDDVFLVKESENTHFSNNLVFEILNTTKSKILLVGEVQSGKTREITNLIKYSLSKQKYTFEIIIFFGGTNIRLNSQTENRLRNDEDLRNNKRVVFRNFENDYYEEEYRNKTVIFIGPKIKNQLIKIHSTIKNIPNLKGKKILIIDDESDYGSINTGIYGTSTKYSEVINDLFHLIESNGSGFIGVTATPYANIFNKKSITYTDIIALPNKKQYGYTGITYFNKLPNFYIDIEKAITVWKELGGLHDPQGKMLYFVFCVFIINSLIKKSITDSPSTDWHKSDLLINNEYAMKEHNKISEDLQSIIVDAKKALPTFVTNLKKVAGFIHKNIEVERGEVNEILQALTVVVLNSKTTSYEESTHNIFIGGVLLSRGITYENLVVEYIDNFPEKSISCDTLSQMCRWFGYRQYLNKHHYMNVITSGKGIKAMGEIETFNDVFFKEGTEQNGCRFTASQLHSKFEMIENECTYIKGCSHDKR